MPLSRTSSALIAALLLALSQNSAGQATGLAFSALPTWRSTEDLAGHTWGANTNDYRVLVYIRVGGSWWVKPTDVAPLTAIGPDHTWSCDVTTGGSDEYATAYMAFLVPSDCDPDATSMTQKQALFPWTVERRPPGSRTISFAGHEWTVKDYDFPVGPGGNYFSDAEDYVWVDSNGYLHLRIAYSNSNWYCSELVATDVADGYGTYQFSTLSDLTAFDTNVVAGFFTWDGVAETNHYREIDIELSRWGVPGDPNAQFVVQPHDTAGNRLRFSISSTGVTTHAFNWMRSRIDFSSSYGTPPQLSPITNWTYTGADIPPAGRAHPRLNLWLFNQTPPGDGQPVELIVHSARFTPSPYVPPAWWYERNVVDTNAVANELAAVNQGQLKWLTRQLHDEMQQGLSAGAGAVVSNLVNGFNQGNNYAVVNQGQAKELFQPIYHQLGAGYPWTPSTSDDHDHAPLLQGALKRLAYVDISQTVPQDNQGYYIYRDSVSTDWQDWSWNAVNVEQSTDHASSGDFAFQSALSNYGAVKFQHVGAAPPTNYTHLSCWLHGGTAGGQTFEVRMGVAGKVTTAAQSTDYVTVVSGAWSRLVIPLSDLGVAPADAISNFWLQCQTASTLATFWLDDVALLTPVHGVRPAIRVDAAATTRTLGPHCVGINTAAWDAQMNNTSTLARLQEMGVNMLRYPGGAVADNYDWAQNSYTISNDFTGYTDYSGFLAVADSIESGKNFTFNYGSGSPAMASNWLSSVLAAGTNHAATSWCLGNENYGNWSYDTNAYQHDALTYATFFTNAAAGMRAIAPGVQLGVGGTYRETDYGQRVTVVNPVTGTTNGGWSAVLLHSLAAAGAVPDFYEIHHYPYNSGEEEDARLLQSVDDWGYLLLETRRMLVQYLGPAGADVSIIVGENNCVSGDNPGKQSTSLVNAMYLAMSCAEAWTHGAEQFLWWDLHNGINAGNDDRTLYGIRDHGDYGVLAYGDGPEPLNTPYPTFFALKLLRRFARPGDHIVRTQSPHPLVNAYAALDANGDTLRVLVVNKSALSDITADLQVDGFSPGTNAVHYCYGPTNVLHGTISSNVLGVVAADTIEVLYPSYSISIVELSE